MVSFSFADYIIIFGFFLIILAIGFYVGRVKQNDSAFQLSGRKVGLLLFIVTNVSTWYGGILGVGEFTYNYGLLSWVTQGLPYYIFAFIFALFFASKIRNAGLYTLPEKLKIEYGELTGKAASIIVFVLVSPAPYLLMLSIIFQAIFGISNILALLLALTITLPYMIKGGYKADLFTDAFAFVVMFAGFIVFFFFAHSFYGGIDYLSSELPTEHLTFSGGASPVFMIVWFMIALWTFADPGFHQRCSAAKSGNTAKWGIILSIPLWALFDFLTTSTGMYARAALPHLQNPSMSYILLAENILGPGFKGLFYAGLFATILSTANSFIFLSGTTIGNDFLSTLNKFRNWEIKKLSGIGMILTGITAFIFAYFIPSVVQIWYLIGSVCIPGLIFLVIGAYYEKFRISGKFAFIEILAGVGGSLLGIILQKLGLLSSILNDIEPMIIGISFALVVHLIGMVKSNSKNL